MKKWVNWIKHQEENLYKMFKNIVVKNYIQETTRFFLQKKGVNQTIINRDSIGLKISKTSVITAEPPYHAKVWEYPLGGHVHACLSLAHQELLGIG